MASTEEFDCLVLGDEPAGLWLLREVGSVMAATGGSASLGWVQLSPRTRAIPVATQLAREYRLSVSEPWSVEMVTPSATFPWNEREIASRFPGTGLPRASLHSPKSFLRSGAVRAAGEALRRYPELLGLSHGIWKLVGRTSRVQPETIVLSALLCPELASWDAGTEPPESVIRVPVAQGGAGIASISFSRRGLASVELVDQTTLLARHLVVNASSQAMREMLPRLGALAECLGARDDSEPRDGLYPFRLTCDRDVVPDCVPRVCVLVDEESLPDPVEEIRGLEIADSGPHRELTVWESWPRGLSLEGLCDRFRVGLARLHRLFPFLRDRAHSYFPPLGVDTCQSEETRARILAELEASCVRQHGYALITSTTRRRQVSHLSPALHSYLPYPFGPLWGARETLSAIVGKKRLRQSRRPTATP